MLGLANSLWVLFASRMLDGITGGNISVAQAYMTDITSEKDRDAYLVHPDHQEFGKLVRPLVADVFVIDFWAK
jgi:MFS family permease